MAKAHTSALKALSTALELPVDVRLVPLAGRSPERTEAYAKQRGFDSWTTDWRAMIEDLQVEVVVT